MKKAFHDRQIWQIWQKSNAIFKNNYNLEFKCKDYSIFPVFTRVLAQKIQSST